MDADIVTVSEFLDRLDGVETHGDYWKAKCPAHEDDHASLSITEGQDGRILLNCHAGCANPAVVARMGLAMTDLFSGELMNGSHPEATEAGRRVAVATRKPSAKKPLGEIVAVFDYTDAEGNLLFQVVRFDDKEFRQRRPDGRGGWVWGMGKLQPVLYRLPRVLAAAAAGIPVWIAEGERDVHTLEAWGLVATTSPMGAGKWRASYAEALREARAIVLPDNDDPGRDHVFGTLTKLGVAPSLAAAHCRVRVVALPGLPEKGDVSDWAAIGGTREELIRLGKDTRDWKPPGEEDGAPAGVPQLTDLGNAYRFAAEEGEDLRYCDVWNTWLVWSGTHWERDRIREVETRAHESIKRLFSTAWLVQDTKEQQAQSKFALACQSDKAITAMVRRARAMPAFQVTPEQFDGRPWLFNCANGTVDLVTGKLLEGRRDDLLTQLCPTQYDRHARAPLWEQFVLDVMAGREHLASFIQRALGYSITGTDRERVMFLLWGGGANGKSTLLDIFRRLLADYGHKLRREALMMKRMQAGQAAPEIASLRGKRFAYLSETAEGGRLDEATVKELTGREHIRTRDLYEKEFGFTLEAKLWLGTNHKPVIQGTDDAIWDRLPLLPFEVRFVDAPAAELDPANKFIRPMDRQLAEKLALEMPGILAWAVKGCLEWQKTGLAIPAEILQATQAYRSESDFIAAFIAECCVTVFGIKCRMKELHERYIHWAQANNAPALSQRKLTPMIEAKGFTHESGTGNATWWSGLGLQSDLEVK